MSSPPLRLSPCTQTPTHTISYHSRFSCALHSTFYFIINRLYSTTLAFLCQPLYDHAGASDLS